MLGQGALGELAYGQPANLITTNTFNVLASVTTTSQITVQNNDLRLLLVSSAQQVRVAKTLVLALTSFAISAAQVVTLRRSPQKLVGLASLQAMTIARNLIKLILASSPQAVLRLYVRGKFAGLSNGESVIAYRQYVRPQTLILSQGNVLTNGRSLGHLVSVAQASFISIPRNLVKLLTNFTQNSVVTVTRTMSRKSLIAQDEAVTAFVRRALSRVVLASFGEVVTLVRKQSRLSSITSPESVTFEARKTITKALMFVQTQVITTAKFILKSLVVSSPQKVLRVVSVSKRVFWSNGLVVVLSKYLVRMIIVTSSLTSRLLRTNQKLLRWTQPYSLTLARPLVRIIAIIQQQHLRVLRRSGHSLLFTQAQVVSVRRKSSRVLRLAQAQAATLRRNSTRVLLVRVRQAITLKRSMSRLTSVHQTQIVTLLRGNRHKVAVTLGQMVSVARHTVFHYSVLIVVTLAQTVTTVRNRGKLIAVSQTQTVVLAARNVSKFITVRIPSIVTLNYNALVRRLIPSLFALGLTRKRTAYEVPRVSSTNVLTPPIEPVVEYENVGFDYGLILDEGVVITSAVVSATVYDGTDPNPQNILISYPVIGQSTRTGQPSQQVVQEIGNTVDLNTYRLQCAATCSDGQVKVLSALIQSVVS